MIKAQSKFVQQTMAAMMVVLVLGALSMIWPGIISIFLVLLLLLQACCIEHEFVALVWSDVGHSSMVFDSLRRPTFSAMVP